MNNLLKEFVSNEPRNFSFKIGKDLASSLSGFVAGIIVASIVWYTSILFLSDFFTK
ncbi:MAG: hypothetical protein NTU81_00470 [Candidatus Nomurabacteria bacterium]|nr:hypothetical protein [Candidatus Nomurabacteria bacterium]